MKDENTSAAVPAADTSTDTAATAAQQHPAAVELCETLDNITENAQYAADPRAPIAQFARAFAKYLRTPD